MLLHFMFIYPRNEGVPLAFYALFGIKTCHRTQLSRRRPGQKSFRAVYLRR